MTVLAPPEGRVDAAFRRWADAHPERPGGVLCDQNLALSPMYELIADLVAQRSAGRALDLGTGFGAIATRLAARGREVVGVDRDQDVLAAAAAIAATAGLGTRLELLRSDAAAVPLDPGSFDLVVASLLFQHVPDPESVAAEAFRLSSPGGTVAIFDVDDGLGIVYPETGALRRLEEAFKASQAGLSGDREIGRKLPGLLDGAGFEQIDVYVLPQARFPGTSPGSEERRLTTERFLSAKEGIIGSGKVSVDEFDALVAAYEASSSPPRCRIEGRVLVFGKKAGPR